MRRPLPSDVTTLVVRSQKSHMFSTRWLVLAEDPGKAGLLQAVGFVDASCPAATATRCGRGDRRRGRGAREGGNRTDFWIAARVLVSPQRVG